MKKIVGYAHIDTLKKKQFGWHYPILCTRKSFLRMIKGLGKGSKKYWRKVMLTIEEI